MTRAYDLEFLDSNGFFPKTRSDALMSKCDKDPAYEWGSGCSHNGHSLTSPTWLRFMPPLPEDDGDLFDANPDYGHERIERDALRTLHAPADLITAIYFGNWQRDYSQLIVPAFPRIFGSRSGFICNLIFEVVDVVAEAKFGKRLDRIRFGTYRWEEHIDNPREYGVSLNPSTCTVIPEGRRRLEDEPEAPRHGLSLWSEGRGAIQNYILASQNYVLRQLGLAMQHGRNDRQGRGLEHFGNALHTIEDFYAHSNFIELCLTQLTGFGDPMTGRWASNGQPVRDSLGRYRLTTGVFLLGDTLVSLEKLLITHYEGRTPGSEPSNMREKILRVLIRRLLGDVALTVYDQLMRAFEATGIPAIKRVIEQQIERALFYPLRSAVAQLLRPLVDASAQQTGNRAFPIPGGNDQIIETSHSRLAKDAQNHPYNLVARSLAIVAVRAFWQEISNAWARRLPRQGPELQGTRFRQLLDRFMNHPQAVGNWWLPIVRTVQPTGGVRTAPARVPPTRPRPVRVPASGVRAVPGRPVAHPVRTRPVPSGPRTPR